MFCKTIILSNSENLNSNAPKGILTLSCDNHATIGKIRLYNMLTLPQSTKIGLYVNDNVHISKLIKKVDHYEFTLTANVDISKNIYCALIDTANNKKVLLEGGNSNGFCFSDSPFDSILETKDDDLEETIEKSIDNCYCDNCNCTNCEYKNYFYQHYQSNCVDYEQNSNLHADTHQYPDCKDTYFNPPIDNKLSSEYSTDKIQSNIVDKLNKYIIDDIENRLCELEQNVSAKTIEPLPTTKQDKPKQEDSKTQEKLDFLNEIIYQLDEMFERYPNDDTLNSIIPNSRFISVDGDNPYVLGVIYEDQMLKYIAYGVPATYNSLPPKDFGRHYQWLPLNPRDVMSDGYFMIYQDALTGTIVEINFEE